MSKDKTEVATNSQIKALGNALDAVMAGSGPKHLCKQVVHSGLADGHIRGCTLFYLDNSAHLKPVASYGQVMESHSAMTAWDDNPLGEAIRSKTAVLGLCKQTNQNLSVLAFPLVANGVPSGLAVLIIDSKDVVFELLEPLAELVSKLGAFYLKNLDVGPNVQVRTIETKEIDDPTKRQLKILDHIDNGLINGEIALDLMLSESTIRQETVRIYKSLGVGNRYEAVKKAKALGFLAKKKPVQDSF